VAELPPERSPAAIALEWSVTIMTIAAEMVVPGLMGHWLDKKLNLKMPVFLLIGFALGGLLAALSLARIAKTRGGQQ
jgi:Putative F0F1-ATPase subunit Ca2+/Mg2+ transporter